MAFIPAPADLPDPGIKPGSPAFQADSLPAELPGKSLFINSHTVMVDWILWTLDVKNWIIGKDPDAQKYWRQEEKGTTEDEMVGWHHRLYGREFE